MGAARTAAVLALGAAQCGSMAKKWQQRVGEVEVGTCSCEPCVMQ